MSNENQKYTPIKLDDLNRIKRQAMKQGSYFQDGFIRVDDDTTENGRDISVIIGFCPDREPKMDIFPYWKVTLIEEEKKLVVFFHSTHWSEAFNLAKNCLEQKGTGSFIETIKF